MATPERPTTDAADDLLAAAGIVSTPEGRAWARKALADADKRMTPEKRQALREKLGIATDAA